MTFGELILAISDLPSGNTLINHLKSIQDAEGGIRYRTVVEERIIYKTHPRPSSTATTSTKVRLPPVTVLENTPQAIQQALEDIARNVQKALR
jgi:hypothetical protein